MSKSSNIMTVREMIDKAFGDPRGNVVDHKLIQTILYLLARQLRLLERRVEVEIGPMPYVASGTSISITEIKIHTTQKKKKVVQPVSYSDQTDKTSTEKTSTDKTSTDKTSTDKTSNEKTSTDKTSTDKTSTDKTSTEKTSTDKTSTDKTTTDETSTEKTSTDKTSTDKTSTDKTSTDKTTTDETSTEKTSTDKTSTDKTSTDKTSTEKTSTDKTSTDKTSSEKISSIDKIPSINETSTEKPSTEKIARDKISEKHSPEKATSRKPSSEKFPERSIDKESTGKSSTFKSSTDKASMDKTSTDKISSYKSSTDYKSSSYKTSTDITSSAVISSDKASYDKDRASRSSSLGKVPSLKRRTTDTGGAAKKKPEDYRNLLGTIEERRERELRVIRQRADSFEQSGKTPTPMASLDSVEAKYEKLLVVERVPSDEAKARAGKTDSRGRTSQSSLVTKEEFDALQEDVRKLVKHRAPIPTPGFPDNAQLMEDLRKGASLTDAMAALQLSARLEATEKTLTEMLSIVTDLASKSSRIDLTAPRDETRIIFGPSSGLGIGGDMDAIAGTDTGDAAGLGGGTAAGAGASKDVGTGEVSGAGKGTRASKGASKGAGTSKSAGAMKAPGTGKDVEAGVGAGVSLGPRTSTGAGADAGAVAGLGAKAGVAPEKDMSTAAELGPGASADAGEVAGPGPDAGAGVDAGTDVGAGASVGLPTEVIKEHTRERSASKTTSAIEVTLPQSKPLQGEEVVVSGPDEKAASRDCVTYEELDNAMQELYDEIFKKITSITTRTTSAADNAYKLATRLDGKLNSALNLGNRMTDLETLIAEYAEQINIIDTSLSSQMTNYQEQLTQMQHDLETGLETMAEMLANAGGDTVAVAELNTHFNNLQLDFDTMAHRQRELKLNQNALSFDLGDLWKQIELLRASKADREEVTDALRDKAGIGALNGLVSLLQFEAVRGDFEKRIGAAYDTFNNQEIVWQKAIDELLRELNEKADKIQILSLSDDINKHINALRSRLNAMLEIVGEPRAAAISRRLFRDAACLSCSTPAQMHLEEPGKVAALPTSQGARQPAVGAEATTKSKGDGDHGLCYLGVPIPHPRDPRSHVCQRYCGGSHTLLKSTIRVPPGITINSISKPIATGPGTDGKMYMLDETVQTPCLPCNVPKTTTPRTSIVIKSEDPKPNADGSDIMTPPDFQLTSHLTILANQDNLSATPPPPMDED